MDTHENISDSKGTSEITNPNIKIPSPIDKLTKIVNDLLDISKMQAGQLSFHTEPFELDSLIWEIVEDVQATTLSHQFLIDGEAGVQISRDKDRLEQVFVNLLTNAVKYSPHADKAQLSTLHCQSYRKIIWNPLE